MHMNMIAGLSTCIEMNGIESVEANDAMNAMNQSFPLECLYESDQYEPVITIFIGFLQYTIVYWFSYKVNITNPGESETLQC